VASLAIERIGKSFGLTAVLHGVDLDIATGEFVTLLGPSGCGKTTLLRIIAGLAEPDHGRVLIGGADVTATPPNARGLGMVFQSHALFPHMTVLDNVCFGLRARGVPRAEREQRAMEALALVRLDGLAGRLPRALSGGQQQRAAIARAVVITPRVLLMDEPFGALDRKLRDALQVELRRLVRTLGITTVFVTHDQDEALVLSDRIALMDAGAIAQFDTPHAVFRRPATRFAADFMGVENLFEARITEADGAHLALEVGPARLVALGAGSGAVSVAIRGEDIRLASPTQAINTVSGSVADVIYRGDRWSIGVDTPIGRMVARPPAAGGAAPPVAPGATIGLAWPEDAVLVLHY
jgi:putative spermidine/putrescine transport system ATP-binding protein